MGKQISCDLQVLERDLWLTKRTYGQSGSSLAEAFGFAGGHSPGVRVVDDSADSSAVRTIFRDVIKGYQLRSTAAMVPANDAAPVNFPMEAFAAAAMRLLGATVTLIGAVAGVVWLA
jgi:hypothetical protein